MYNCIYIQEYMVYHVLTYICKFMYVEIQKKPDFFPSSLHINNKITKNIHTKTKKKKKNL